MVIVGRGSISTKSTLPEIFLDNDIPFFLLFRTISNIDRGKKGNEKRGGGGGGDVEKYFVGAAGYLLNRLFNGAFVIPVDFFLPTRWNNKNANKELSDRATNGI